MRIGISGCHYGHIGMMLRDAGHAGNANIVGVLEADEERIGWFDDLKGVDQYASLEDLLEQAKPELVLEGVTHPEKPALIETCAEAGVHLLLDKPLCRTRDELDRIKNAVDAGIHISMFSSRFHPPFVALRQAIEAGELGQVVSIISTHPHKLGGRALDFYYEHAAYVGVFHDLACHGVDQVRYLTGAEYSGVHAIGSSVHKHTGKRSFSTDHVQASFEMSDGSSALLTADWLTPNDAPTWGDTRVIVMGTGGSAHLRAYAESHLYIVSEEKGAYEPELPESTLNSFVQDMVHSIERGDEPFISS